MERVFETQMPTGEEIRLEDHGDKVLGYVNDKLLVKGEYTPDNVSEYRSQYVYGRAFLEGFVAGQNARKVRRKRE